MNRLLLVLAALGVAGCTYLHYVSVHAGYKRAQVEDPSQWTAKHSLGAETYFVYGRLLNEGSSALPSDVLSIAAFSNRYQRDELVEINQLGRTSSYYGLNLPSGDYRLLAFADVNRNGAFEANEVVGERSLMLGSEPPAQRVVGGVDISVSAAHNAQAPPQFKPITVRAAQALRTSLFYPKGTLRSLDDALFSSGMSQLGLYDPAAFVETAPMMFYALEEDLGHKVPVIFVHGIGGSPAQFGYLIERMDRARYKPWFYFYPSGGDLEQLARLFRDVFLSGKVIPVPEVPMVIVAHSMGGLVVREAMNQCERDGCGNKVALLITVATPFGGVPSASMGVSQAPLVPPAWRGLDPSGPFLRDLFRTSLPDGTVHHLLYAYRNHDERRGTDGVAPLSSQLAPSARREAATIQGFKSGHAQVLRDPTAVAHILTLVSNVQSGLSEEQLKHFDRGGFDVPLGEAYSEHEKYAIRNLGYFLRALAVGRLSPAHPVEIQFVNAIRGETPPTTPVETAWIQFRADYPQLATEGAEP